MSHQMITNPLAAHREVTDYTTGIDSEGGELDYGNIVRTFRADAAIARGEVVNWVAPTTTAPLSVTPMAAATADNLKAGVALEAAAAGEQVDICVNGYCFVDVAAETAAFGSVLTVPGTTTGKGEIGAVAAFDNVIGITLGAKDANNLAPAMVHFVV